MRTHFFPYRHQFEYDRHILFTYEFINEVERLVREDYIQSTTNAINEMDRYLTQAKDAFYTRAQNYAILRKKKGMMI